MSDKENIKIGMVIDSYKMPQLEEYWNECMKRPEFIKAYPNMNRYELVSQSIKDGLVENVKTVVREYKLKEVENE